MTAVEKKLSDPAFRRVYEVHHPYFLEAEGNIQLNSFILSPHAEPSQCKHQSSVHFKVGCFLKWKTELQDVPRYDQEFDSYVNQWQK